MRFIRSRRPVAAALLAVAGGMLFAAQSAQSASAATFLKTIDSASASGQQASLQLSISSTTNNSPLKFVPRFKGTAACGTCGVTNTPPELTWAQIKVVPSAAGLSLVNKATNKCADIDFLAQQDVTKANGARIVLSACDGTLSQQWKLSVFAGNQSTFQTLLPGTDRLMLTNAEGKVVLEPITVNNGLPTAERRKHIQSFGSTFVNIQ